MAERIINQNMLSTYIDDTVAYMIEVIRLRQIPDYKDGLKKVHRRVVDAMLMNEHCVADHVKSAAIVGTVMKKSHPQQ